ncbi:iron chelate uptake ABC transporter family permease subunit [Aliiglaciecola sp. CAU 1673]|uniref:FecCD family ABC transporter permease n=1 Tax=Aliiglaciecola sp. CAU 1673 TaxID=3032595 RepID=UPI0023DAB1D4|nr:iron chelate uptake ABC transporter family permease subunit [Aliiglaciecola sp. CAU 1673]MDF2179912.1 iron chelate uptake ABC transporter family permease subunit [Aliiglaciecola sp. CAU 1673]
MLSIILLFHQIDLASLTDKQILLQLRLPLVLCALMVGACLAVSSAFLQVMLKNPLADPGIIGISSGASLFAALYLLSGGWLGLTLSQYGLPLFSFIGAMLSTLLIYAIARRLVMVSASAVILAGIAISTLSGGIIAWLYFFSDAQSLRNLTFWLMGSLHQADLQLVLLSLPLVVMLLFYALRQARALNWLYLGRTEAQVAGLDVTRFYPRLLLTCALLVGIAVSLAGSVAFVGLLVPHLLRNLFGYDNRFILPASALCGALLMLLVLLVSKAFGGVAVPVSMLTATLGGPLFLYSVLKLGGR